MKICTYDQQEQKAVLAKTQQQRQDIYRQQRQQTIREVAAASAVANEHRVILKKKMQHDKSTPLKKKNIRCLLMLVTCALFRQMWVHPTINVRKEPPSILAKKQSSYQRKLNNTAE